MKNQNFCLDCCWASARFLYGFLPTEWGSAGSNAEEMTSVRGNERSSSPWGGEMIEFEEHRLGQYRHTRGTEGEKVGFRQ